MDQNEALAAFVETLRFEYELKQALFAGLSGPDPAG
jgi:hypothetical protein